MKQSETKISDKVVKRWYLEMDQKPSDLVINFPDNIEIREFSGNTNDYRKLNKLVGGDLGWVDRQIMPDEELDTILKNPKIKIFELYQKEELIGLSELDFTIKHEVDLVYFGLTPQARGKGFGRLFLQWTIHEAWKNNPKKFKLNTCEIDHPNALPNYLKAGFKIVKEEYAKQAVII